MDNKQEIIDVVKAAAIEYIKKGNDFPKQVVINTTNVFFTSNQDRLALGVYINEPQLPCIFAAVLLCEKREINWSARYCIQFNDGDAAVLAPIMQQCPDFIKLSETGNEFTLIINDVDAGCRVSFINDPDIGWKVNTNDKIVFHGVSHNTVDIGLDSAACQKEAAVTTSLINMNMKECVTNSLHAEFGNMGNTFYLSEVFLYNTALQNDKYALIVAHVLDEKGDIIIAKFYCFKQEQTVGSVFGRVWKLHHISYITDNYLRELDFNTATPLEFPSCMHIEINYKDSDKKVVFIDALLGDYRPVAADVLHSAKL